MKKKYKFDYDQFPKELQLILSFLEEDLYRSNYIVKKNHYTNMNWDLFIRLTKHHRVFSIVYKRIKEIDSKLIPSYVIESLKKEYQKNIFRMLTLSGESEKISILFSEAKIRTLFLKGPVLAADLYGDVSLRTSADLDILIPLENLLQAEELLIEEGYIKDDYFSTVLKDWKWRHHHITFFHPGKQLKVEIHWRLNPGPSKEPNFNELWKRKRKSALSSFPIYSLGLEDLFLFLVSHGGRHGWSRLRWLADIGKLAQSSIDWEETFKLLKNNWFLPVGGQAFILAEQLLRVKVPEDMNKIINRKRSERLASDALFYIRKEVNLHSEPVPKEIANYHKRHLFSLMPVQQKLLFILSFLLPLHEDTEILPLPQNYQFLYFPLRPFLWIWRKTKKPTLPRRI